VKKLAAATLILLCATAFAQSPSINPGLWEINVIRQVIDGRDMTAQLAAAQTKMQQAMANMSPEQRQRLEAMMGGQGMPVQSTATGGTRVCISAAMAARDRPLVDPQGLCEPAKFSRSGNKISFEFNCTANGGTSVGKGESTIGSDMVTNSVDMTVTDARGQHTMRNESQMKYLGPDCQGIKPIDELAKDAKSLAH
jgi:hypothetical protein